MVVKGPGLPALQVGEGGGCCMHGVQGTRLPVLWGREGVLPMHIAVEKAGCKCCVSSSGFWAACMVWGSGSVCGGGGKGVPAHMVYGSGCPEAG